MREKDKKTQNGLIEKIGLGEKVAYGFGDLASNLILALTSTMITYFYTNVIGIAAGAVGTIMLVSRIFDGFTDVGMGIVVDKTNTKYGKARPWLLWLAIPFALSAVVLIAIPESFSPTSKFVYAFITYRSLRLQSNQKAKRIILFVDARAIMHIYGILYQIHRELNSPASIHTKG